MNYKNCIYMYINKINNKKYVGQTKCFERRHKDHIIQSYNCDIECYAYNVPFHRAIRKYGIENFEIKILAHNIPTQEKLNEYEIFFIKRYKTLTTQNGYNCSSGGLNGNNFAGKTEEEMDEIKQKLRDKKLGNNHPRLRKTAQYDLNGNLIKIYNSSKQATEETKVNHGNIVSCCKFWEIECDESEWYKKHSYKPMTQAGEFIWKYIKNNK